jgi:hypothetical protein
MALDINGIRGWLLCQPRASTLRVLTAEDQNHEVAVTNGVSWMAIAQSIHALDPMRIEAYDADGKIIRVIRPREENVSPRPADATAAQPLILPPGTDPQSMLLLHFADLLAGAYRHSTDVAFERLASLFEAVNHRSESLERSLDTMHRLLRKAYQEQIDNAPPEKEPDLLHDMVAGFMQGKTQGADDGHGSNGKAG